MIQLPYKIILASKSPRRVQLLKEAGFDFEIKAKEVEEDYPADMPVEEVAPFLARKKAEASRQSLQEKEVLLTADSVVILDGQIFGKPVDAADAARILRMLSGRIHTVVTGVCLLSVHKQKVFSAVSRVHFETLTHHEIDQYIRVYKPFDKAGAYAVQEWVGLCKISRIEGTYSNIMGLPIDLVYKELMQW